MDSNNEEAHVLSVVATLLEAAADRDELVREAVITSLRQLAKKYPSKVLRWAVEYRSNNPKMSVSHLAALLRTMELVCQERLADVDGDEVLQLIQFSVSEMTRTQEYLPSLQMPAAGILTALGKAHCNEVMEGLLKHFQPGVLPHYAVLHTMGCLASANVFGIIPFVKATLGTMLPMMGMLRTDAMRQVFAFALGKFSEAVSEYMANIDQAPDPTVKLDVFSTELSIAYDVLASAWIHSKEQKVVETVLHALGPMVDVLPPQKVGEQLPRLISTLLALYRRNMNPHPVTQCLAAVLLVAVTHCKALLEPQLDHLLGVMFDLVCTSPDYAQPLTVKNHYEVLRCFDRLACHFTDRVVELLMQQLRNNNERERIKALFVVTHLVNSSEHLLRARIVDLMMGLRGMLAEHSIKVKKVLLKTIVAFAYRGYMEPSEGREFVEFIVKHSCAVVTPAGKDGRDGRDEEAVQGEELRVTCGNTLYLLATTVPQVEGLMWHLLLSFLLEPQYIAASPVLARCLAHLATKRDDTLLCSTSLKGPVPCASSVFGRCLVLLGRPLESSRAVFVLTFLKSYASSANRHLRPLWDQKIPELLQHIEDYKDKWQESLWDDLVLELLSATLNEVDEEKWTLDLGMQMVDQLRLYTGHLPEKCMLYKCLAVVACHTSDKQYVQKTLEVLLAGARHHCPIEARAVARAVGISTRAHLQDVLSRLRRLSQDELGRKSSRLLPFIKDRQHEGELERVRHTLLLCYGEVAQEAPGEELLPQLEHGPAHWVLQQLSVIKDAQGTAVALGALGSVVEAFHPNRNSLQIALHGRAQVLQLVLEQLALGPSTYPSALQVLTALVKLPPPLSPEERVEVLKTCFTHVFLGVKTDASPREVTAAGLLWSEEAAVILYALGTLVQELLLLSVTPAILDEVFTLLEPWLAASGTHERAAATATLSSVLQCYLDNLKFGYEAPSRFSQTGHMLGCVVPRCTDPSLAVRQKAVDCVRLVLCVAARYEGQHADHDNNLTSALSSVQERVLTDDPVKLYQAIADLATVTCSKLAPGQLVHLADSLIEGALDPAPSSACGASVVLNTLFQSKGGELYHHVPQLLASLLSKLGSVQCEQAHTGCLRAVLSLTAHHPKAVVAALLHQPIPYSAPVVDCWMMLARDPDLSSDVVEQLVRLVSTTPLCEQLPDKERFKMAELQPLAAISALREMFRVASMHALVTARLPELFTLLYLAVASYVGASPPVHTPHSGKDRLSFVPNRNAYKLSPARVAHDALQGFLLCARCDSVAEALLHCAGIDSQESLTGFVSAVPHLVRALCACVPHLLPKLITHLNQYSTSSYDPQRVAVAAFYSELTKLQVNGQMLLLESVVSSQLNCLGDPSPLVRQLCLAGLASVARLEPDQRGRYAESVLAALTQGLDDHDASGSIALAAVRGFLEMLPVMEEHHVLAVQGTVAIRIKHLFEREDGNMRAAAIRMFGELARCSVARPETAFREQVTGNLVCFLLHLSDGDDEVVKACKFTLRQVGPLLGARRTSAMLQDHLLDAATLHFSDFMADLVKLLGEERPDLVPHMTLNALAYTKSSWPALRGNAAILIGTLHGALPVEQSGTVRLDSVCARLAQLLSDEDASVRVKAAKAAGCLFPG
ncbi:maestro heat-like repeat-containing protein family member 1 isoform X2 [Bacillus rossius redtenbacheri]|uniref:maestro heat-like repeat-containing protein family member 1 isoform X2 n=1 Tax=Bacillus rossius redtenbacheri TaxID=93214 RepID=UPI002FDCC176